MGEAMPELGQRCCWLCDRPIEDPPRVVGQILVGEVRLAHYECVTFVNSAEREMWESL